MSHDFTLGGLQRDQHMYKWHILIVSMFLSISLVGQQADDQRPANPTFLGATFEMGYLLPHSQSLRDIPDAFPFAVGLDWSKLLLTERSWDFCNCFPRLGVRAAYWNYDNPDVLGSGIVVNAYAEPYFRTHRPTSFFVRMGMGGAYLDNPYDAQSNPQNLSYSTHLSFSLIFGIGVNYRINPKLNLRLAAHYNHLSNGGVRTPNKGLNAPTINIGVYQSLEPVTYPDFEPNGKRPPPAQKTRISLAHFSSWSNASVGDKSKFYVAGLVANYSRWIGGRSALMAGTEWIADYSRKELLRLADLDRSFLQGSLLVGHAFWLGRVTFSQQLGLYYFNEFRNTDDVYQRYGLTYRISRHFFAGVNLKAHRHVADFFDFRVGFIF